MIIPSFLVTFWLPSNNVVASLCFLGPMSLAIFSSLLFISQLSTPFSLSEFWVRSGRAHCLQQQIGWKKSSIIVTKLFNKVKKYWQNESLFYFIVIYAMYSYVCWVSHWYGWVCFVETHKLKDGAVIIFFVGKVIVKSMHSFKNFMKKW